jgi:hypothetical protein
MYKNLLQESAQREGLSIPIYKTIKIGPCHMPTFFSTVEVKGEIFRGKGGKSKKHAELNAAKVAYSFLKQGKSLVSFVIVSIYLSMPVILMFLSHEEQLEIDLICSLLDMDLILIYIYI